METHTSSLEALKPPSNETLEERLKKTEDELHRKCAEIVVLQQALQNLEKRVLDLESRAPLEVFIFVHSKHYFLMSTFLRILFEFNLQVTALSPYFHTNDFIFTARKSRPPKKAESDNPPARCRRPLGRS
jgi:hypothetical protein